MKRLARWVFAALNVPLALYWLARLVVPKGRAFADTSQLVACVPGLVGEYVRYAFYRATMPRCGRDVVFGFGTLFSHPGANVGNHVYIGSYCVLGDVTLEEDVLLASGVSIANGTRQHHFDRLDVPVRLQGGEFPPLTVGADTWIGERAVVLANVGRRCVVGAGALVLDDLPDYAIAVGVPAKIIGSRRETEN